jgi:probable F420-dependent oxidoreductase
VSPLPRLSVGPWGDSLAELADASRRAEANGADTLWVAELHRSATVALSAVAQATSRARVGTAIMWAFVRSPMMTALEALDLDELSGGRLVLGLGSGVRRLNENWHHARWGKPVAHLREVVRDVRYIVAHAHDGQPILLDGDHEPVRIVGYQRPFGPPVRTEIPVYLAAMGPAMTRLAGEVADGWIAHELGSPDYLRQVTLPNLAQGLERSGRGRADIDVVASACCVPHRDARQAKRWAAGLIAFYASVRTYEPFFDFHGFLGEARAVQKAFQDGDNRAMIDLVPDGMVDALTLAGTPDEVRERLTAYHGLVDAVKLTPPTHFVAGEVTRLAQDNIITMMGQA